MDEKFEEQEIRTISGGGATVYLRSGATVEINGNVSVQTSWPGGKLIGMLWSGTETPQVGFLDVQEIAAVLVHSITAQAPA